MLLSFYSHPIISLFLLVALPCLYFLISCIYERVSIRRLGTLSPRVPSYLPFGLDVVYRSVRLSLSNLDLEFWHWLFRYRTHPRSYTVESSLGGQRFIFTADPENIKAILAIKFQDYGKGKQFHSEWEDFLGDSIFTTDGDLWHASRHLIRPQFVKERVKELDIFEEHVQKVIRQLGGQGQEVNIAALFYRFTLDSTTDYLLGHSVGSLDSPQSEFSEAFNYVQKIQSLVARMGLFNRFIPRRTFWRSLEAINAFVEPFIDQVLRMNIQDLKYMSNQSFLQALAATGTRDRKIIRDQVMAVLLAGRDTTAGTLSFLFLELSQHPEVLVKLRQEILNAVGGEERPTYEDLKNMPYLQQTMNEVLRLYPSVPYNVRCALQDTTLPTGGGPDGLQPLGILKDTLIGYSTLYLHRRQDLYPDSPDLPHPHEFSPERWQKWQPRPWQYLPFNGGPRICIGQQFALTEMAYTIVRILQQFDRIDCYTSSEGPRYKAEVILSPCKGVNIGLWRAKAQ